VQFPLVELSLNQGETVYIQRGSMVYHTPNVTLNTKLNASGSGVGRFVKAVGATGNSYNVDMQVQVLDESASKKTTTAASTKVGENYYYKEYNDQIQGALGQSGVYRLKQGDMVSVEVKNTNKTISQVLKNFMYKVTGKGNSNISAQYSGIVNVNG